MGIGNDIQAHGRAEVLAFPTTRKPLLVRILNPLIYQLVTLRAWADRRYAAREIERAARRRRRETREARR